MTDKIIIFDTTLRDGEQSPGASMTKDEKLRIARQLERLKVDVIEAGFADHILISGDASRGYGRPITAFLPRLRAAGASDEVLRRITVDQEASKM